MLKFCASRLFENFCCWAGPGVPIPEHPYPGQKWREVRHDNTVTWLAYWKDPISHKDYKYVWLAANSLFKSDSDLAKYEKARKLKVRRPLMPLPGSECRIHGEIRVLIQDSAEVSAAHVGQLYNRCPDKLQQTLHARSWA